MSGPAEQRLTAMDDLARQAIELGIEREYHDAHGVHRTVGDTALARLVEALSSGAAGAKTQTLVWRQGVTQNLSLPDVEFGASWRLLQDEHEVARGRLNPEGLRIPE